MAKKSMIAREVKREKLVAKFAEKRAALKAIINDKEKPSHEGDYLRAWTRGATRDHCTADRTLSAKRFGQFENF